MRIRKNRANSICLPQASFHLSHRRINRQNAYTQRSAMIGLDHRDNYTMVVDDRRMSYYPTSPALYHGAALSITDVSKNA
jgi:hypothetical protein